jgi:hypothetical protein
VKEIRASVIGYIRKREGNREHGRESDETLRTPEALQFWLPEIR